MSVDEKAQVLQEVESSSGSKRKVLAGLGVSKNDCYRWRARHGQGSPEMKMAAGKEFHTKATHPHQMWATDASYFRVSGWGFYYLVTVMDDFPRFVLAWRLQTDMTSDSFMRLSRTQSTSQA